MNNFIVLLASDRTEGTLTIAVTIILSIIVAAGAGLRFFRNMKDRKLNTSSVEDLINSIYSQEDVMDILRSVFTQDIFVNSSTYDEFIEAVLAKTQLRLQLYLAGSSLIPPELLKFFTVDNMLYVAMSILEYLGYDEKRLNQLFTEFLVHGIITDSNLVEQVEKEDEQVEKEDEEVEEEVVDFETEGVIDLDTDKGVPTSGVVDLVTGEETPDDPFYDGWKTATSIDHSDVLASEDNKFNIEGLSNLPSAEDVFGDEE